MLEELLSLVAKKNMHTPSELAQALGISEALVLSMLEDLARRGYLCPLEGGCPEYCADCPLVNTCAVGSPTRVWALTEKGQRAVDRDKGRSV